MEGKELPSAPACPDSASIGRPRLVVGITDAQTCVVLKGRLRAFQRAGFEVVLLASPGPGLEETGREEGVQVIPIRMKRKIAPWSDLKSLFTLWRTLKRLRPDITEFSTPKAGFLGSLAALLCGVPTRVYLLRGLRLETAAQPTRAALAICETIASACSHAVLCISASLRGRTSSLHLAPRAKLHLLGSGSSNGLDVDRFSPGETMVRRRLGIAAACPVIGYVGRLTRDKGIPELIVAFNAILKALPTAKLLLVGWFDDSEDALSPADRENVVRHPSIVHTGFVEDTVPYYRAMDVMVLPTWREGFPNVVLEAGACGVPVVTTLATGSRDAVLPEVTGLLVPPGHPEAIEEAVRRLLRDPELRRRMGTAARAWITEHFLDTRVQEMTAAFYRELLERPAAAPRKEISARTALD